MRREAEQHKNTDLRRYYEIWLRVSRLELKQCSGLAGRCIPDPVPYTGDVRRGVSFGVGVGLRARNGVV